MSCPRCGGLLFAVTLHDASLSYPVWHCLFCGTYLDRVVPRFTKAYVNMDRYRRQHLKAGLCESCPRPRDPSSKTVCTEHLWKRRQRHRVWRQRVEGFQPWRPGGKGRPPLQSEVPCV